jgi:uncharacterized membrane protein YgcG
VTVGVSAGEARAEPFTIKDDGHFFSAEALKKANATIAAIKERYNKDLAIETYAEIPADLKADYDADKKEQFFRTWGHERAAKLNLNGIIVLICRDPRHLEIGVGRKTVQKAFTSADRRKLTELMLTRFRKKEFDAGLLEGVEFVDKTLKKNLE